MQIKVTEKHIKNGVPENCNLCAVSLALAEALFLDSHSVEVYPDHIRGVGYRFRFRSLDSDCGRLSYTMSDSDRDVVDSFIKEFVVETKFSADSIIENALNENISLSKVRYRDNKLLNSVTYTFVKIF